MIVKRLAIVQFILRSLILACQSIGLVLVYFLYIVECPQCNEDAGSLLYFSIEFKNIYRISFIWITSIFALLTLCLLACEVINRSKPKLYIFILIVNGIVVDIGWIAALIYWLDYAWLLPDAFSMLFVYIAFLFMSPFPKQVLDQGQLAFIRMFTSAISFQVLALFVTIVSISNGIFRFITLCNSKSNQQQLQQQQTDRREAYMNTV